LINFLETINGAENRLSFFKKSTHFLLRFFCVTAGDGCSKILVELGKQRCSSLLYLSFSLSSSSFSLFLFFPSLCLLQKYYRFHICTATTLHNTNTTLTVHLHLTLFIRYPQTVQTLISKLFHTTPLQISRVLESLKLKLLLSDN